MSIFKGSGVALVTPFNTDGTINYEIFGKLIDYHISEGTDAIIVCGTTGEASTLTDKEQTESVRFAAKYANGRVPIIAGAGSNDTAHGVNLCQGCEEAGADALLLVTPYYNRATPKGLVSHYTKLAESVKIPVILYSVKSRTGVNIEPGTVAELAKVPNIAAIKEASGNIGQIAQIAALCGDAIDIYSGNDDQILPILSLGGIGVISVAANIVPKDVHELVATFLEGDIKASQQYQLKLIPLVKQLFNEVNPIPVKAAMRLLGYDVGGYRLPLCEPEEANLKLLREAMQNYGLL
ncbi:4-hydroxy-tetrahydrodipicolinate synthase [Clostridia bacterium]|nr:4-hydroxy-tetrahydrodipicolinate synthase [Clostridia bacterium]